MNGRVMPSKDDPPPSAAKAMSSTATRPARVSGRGKLRGVRKANTTGFLAGELMLVGGVAARRGRERIVQILATARTASHNFAERMLVLVALLVAAAPTGTTVTPFRTEVTPRVDPVFGDIASLRQSVDRFLALQGEMDQVRNEFSTS